MKLIDALKQLDPENQKHWTADGLPRMDAVVDLTGEADISRKEVTDAAPLLTRETAANYAYPIEGEPQTPVESVETESADIDTDTDTVQTAIDGVPDESVLAMPIQDVLGSSELTELAIAEINDRVQEVLSRKAECDHDLKQLYAKSEMLGRVKIQHDRAARRNGTKRTNVQDYLAAQAKSRLERTRRAQRFIAAGTTAQDVAAELGSKSKLDAAMSQRKPKPGSQRPAVRTPAQA